MDLVSSCKDKLAYFRIKELKDVLTQLGLPKQGRKQDQVDRILSVLSDEQGSKLQGWVKKNAMGKEEVAKIIDDTYRKMQVHGATDLASKGQNGSNLSNVKPKEEIDDFQLDMKIRCPCGSSLPTESMIQCEDLRCQVWQHLDCVIIPEKPMEGVQPEVPPQFYCEICRINKADPFWVTSAHPLHPVKLTASNLTTDGTNPVQNVERTFQLSRADRESLQKTEYDLQAWCVLLNDKVIFRMQWPQYADLQVNGVPIRTTNRPGSQLLGINGRDDGPAITTCSREGINKISLSGCDARIFCLGVRIARRRTVQQVLNLVPKETDGERFEEALARVCRCIGGGAAAENADSDSDLEVVADSVTVNLRCPMSGSRMKVAGRFKPCVHMGCFDLETFVELNQRSRKWQCPICLQNYSLENIIIDPYFNRITTKMLGCGEDVNEIDVKPDGSWRARNESERRDLKQWHFPDGSLCVSTDVEIKPYSEILKQVKQEGGSEGHPCLKLGIKRNRNGNWEVSKPVDMSGDHLIGKFENHCQKIMATSSSATGSYRDGEDPSVNQDGGGLFDFPANNNCNELDSISLNFDPEYGVNEIPAAPLMDANIIVLSDSEDDNVNPFSEGNANPFVVPPPGVTDLYQEEPGLGTSGSTCLGLYNNNGDDFELPPWPLPPCPQEGSCFQLFGTDTVVSDGLVDAPQTSAAHTNGYALATDTNIGAALHVQDPSNSDMNDDLVDNPAVFSGDDPSLQIFLPTRPAEVSVRADLRDHADLSNGSRSEDWISLRLGAGGSSHGESAAPNGLNSRYKSKEGGMDSLANTASLLLSMNDDRSDKAASKKPRFEGGPFSHPKQPRSARPRLYLSIDTDSE
ncbi:E3 SUMO-protein ligase SIZ1-like isoform X2 [Tasmannia lanceolata]|uniref:E3 SUMO-protein ligase SIZ1-like isoform X2 n=1 Tax=Tasmannia lanceolata TaxID=3420 RepID=UPI004062F425